MDTIGRSVDRAALICLPRLYRPASQMMIPARYAAKTTSSDFPVKGIALFLLMSVGEFPQSCKAINGISKCAGNLFVLRAD